MLCEEYPSLFDDAKVRNNLGECKENREFNFPLTFWGCGFLANCFFCLVSSFLVIGLVLSHLTHESAGERKVVVVIDLILYHPMSKRASWIEDKKKAYRHKYFCDDRYNKQFNILKMQCSLFIDIHIHILRNRL